MAHRPRTLAEQIANRCKHFTGIQNNTCSVGVPYKNFEPPLPCLRWADREIKTPCSLQQFPTAEEVAAELKEIDDEMRAIDNGMSTCCNVPLTLEQSGGSSRWFCSKCRKLIVRACNRGSR